ncbi:hypothetical protein Bca4012_076146 [Brassica carinata]
MAEVESFVPFQGIRNDVIWRLKSYKHDWISGFRAGFMILAQTTYIFFASSIHVMTSGELLERDTDGKIITVQTLMSTALCDTLLFEASHFYWCCRAYCNNVHLHLQFRQGYT